MLTEAKIAQLQTTIGKLYGCNGHYAGPVDVEFNFDGKSVWHGTVEAFWLTGHPPSTRCYAWPDPVQGVAGDRYLCILASPSIITPKDAIMAVFTAGAAKENLPNLKYTVLDGVASSPFGTEPPISLAPPGSTAGWPE